MKRLDFRAKYLDKNHYVEALEYYIDNDVESIGILGDYSSGKSSIINTYKVTTNNEVITLSTASFSQKKNINIKNATEKNVDEENEGIQSSEENDGIQSGEENEGIQNDEPKTSLIEEERVELEIIKVFIHHLHNMLEDNTYISTKLSIKKNLSNKKIKVFSILIILSLISLLYTDMMINIIALILISSFKISLQISNAFQLLNIFNVIQFQPADIILFVAFARTISELLIIALISCTLFYILEYSLKYMQVSKVDKNGVSLIASDGLSKNEAIINKEMHILVELFREVYDIKKCSKKKCMVIVFEDIDRFNNEEIFDFLYKLSQNLKHTNMNIKFIFAIRPEMIKNDVTKYFDAIIDVIPHYHILNAATIFKEEALNQIGDITLSRALLNNTVPYIQNARDTKRVINYLDDLHSIHKNFSSERSKTNTNSNMLYAIALLNVLYPNELSLTSEVGKVSNSDTQKIINLIVKISEQNEVPFGIVYKLLNNTVMSEAKGKEIIIRDDEKKQYQDFCNKLTQQKRNVLEYLFNNNYLDAGYKRLLAPNAIKYEEGDQQFLLNFINRGGILNEGLIKLHNPKLIIEEVVEAGSLESYRELINISIFMYYANNREYKSVDKMINNIVKNDMLSIFTKIENTDEIIRKIINHIDLNNSNQILKELPLSEIESLSDTTIIEISKVMKACRFEDEEKSDLVYNLLTDIAFSAEGLFVENQNLLYELSLMLNKSVVLTREKYNVIKSVGKIDADIKTIPFEIETSIIEEVLDDAIIPKEHVYLFMCEEEQNLNMMALSLDNFKALNSFIDDELVSEHKINILNTIFSEEYMYSFEQINSFTYPEILDLMELDKIDYKNDDLLLFTENVDLVKAGTLCFEDIVYSLKEKYIINLVKDTSETAKQLITEYVLFNKINRESKLYITLFEKKYFLNENELMLHADIPEYLLVLFKFDFKVFNDYYYINKTNALIYARNYHFKEIDKFELGNSDIFIDLLSDQKLEDLQLQCIDNLCFENNINLKEFSSVSSKVLKKLLVSPSKGLKYKIEFNSLVEWINNTESDIYDILPIIKHVCRYRTGDDNSVIRHNIIWSNSEVFEAAYEEIKEKFNSPVENIEYLEINKQNINNLSKLIENSQLEDYFNEFYKFLNNDKKKMNTPDKFYESTAVDNIFTMLCKEHNIKRTSKQIRKMK